MRYVAEVSTVRLRVHLAAQAARQQRLRARPEARRHRDLRQQVHLRCKFIGEEECAMLLRYLLCDYASTSPRRPPGSSASAPGRKRGGTAISASRSTCGAEPSDEGARGYQHYRYPRLMRASAGRLGSVCAPRSPRIQHR